MRRTGEIFFLAILVAALPTVVSLCDLRCTRDSSAGPQTVTPACAGHAARRQQKAPRSVPPDESQGCARHVLLARGNAVGVDGQISRAFVATIPSFGPFLVAPDQWLEEEKLASADLSPPLGRSSNILRL